MLESACGPAGNGKGGHTTVLHALPHVCRGCVSAAADQNTEPEQSKRHAVLLIGYVARNAPGTTTKSVNAG